MPLAALTAFDFAAAGLTFCIGFLFSAFDLYQTLYSKDFRTINLLRSWCVWFFLCLCALIGTFVFLLTCVYPGDWIYQVLGQDIKNVFGRAALIGVLITVIMRSKLSNLAGEHSLGPDTLYATLRRQTLVALNTKSGRVFDRTASEFTRRLMQLQMSARELVLRQLSQHTREHLDVMFEHDPNRSNRLKALYTRVIQGQMESAINGSNADQEEKIRDVILWSFRYGGYKEIKRWLTEKAP